MLLISYFFPSNALAWDDCPLGLENDEYPGECPRYIDTDNDGICDHSQPAPEDRDPDDAASSQTDTDQDQSSSTEDSYIEISGHDLKSMRIREIAELWEIDPQTLMTEIVKEFNLTEQYSIEDTLDNLREEYKFSPTQAKEIADRIKGNTNENIIDTVKTDSTKQSKNPYNFPIPFLSTIFFYLFTLLLTKTDYAKKYKFLSKQTFNFFWNTILLITTIPSLIFGIYLIARYSYPDLRKLQFDFLYWHVEGSIVFGTVGLLHLITRLKQYIAPMKTLQKA